MESPTATSIVGMNQNAINSFYQTTTTTTNADGERTEVVTNGPDGQQYIVAQPQAGSHAELSQTQQKSASTSAITGMPKHTIHHSSASAALLDTASMMHNGKISSSSNMANSDFVQNSSGNVVNTSSPSGQALMNGGYTTTTTTQQPTTYYQGASGQYTSGTSGVSGVQYTSGGQYTGAQQYVSGQQYTGSGQYTTGAQYTGGYTTSTGGQSQMITGQSQMGTGQSQMTAGQSQMTTGQSQMITGQSQIISGGKYVTGGGQYRTSSAIDFQTRQPSFTSGPILDHTARMVSRTIIGESVAREGTRYTVTGEERVVGHREFVDESRQSIIGEQVTETEIRVPKKVMIEEIIERVVVIPEKRVREEYVEETQKQVKKVVEIQRAVIHEKIVEVPEIEYVEKIVEVRELIVQEKIKEVAKIELQERITEVPKVIVQERIVEVPEIEYREIPVERIEEQIEIHEQIVVKEIPIPQYVEKPIPEYVTVEEAVDVERTMPIPIEAITTYEFRLPRIRANWKKIDVPLYVPRFVEVPMPIEAMPEKSIEEAERYAQQISVLGFQTATSLCELENLAKAKHVDFQSMIRVDDMHSTLIRAYQAGMMAAQNVQQVQTFPISEMPALPPALQCLGGAAFMQSSGMMQTTTSRGAMMTGGMSGMTYQTSPRMTAQSFQVSQGLHTSPMILTGGQYTTTTGTGGKYTTTSGKYTTGAGQYTTGQYTTTTTGGQYTTTRGAEMKTGTATKIKSPTTGHKSSSTQKVVNSKGEIVGVSASAKPKKHRSSKVKH